MSINTVLVEIEDRDEIQQIDVEIKNIAKNGLMNLSALYHGYEEIIIKYRDKMYLPTLIEGTTLVEELELNDFNLIKTYLLSSSEIKELENSPSEDI